MVLMRAPKIVRRVASDYPTEAEVKREVKRLQQAGRHDLAAEIKTEITREQYEQSRELRAATAAARRKVRQEENERRRIAFRKAFDEAKRRR